MPKGKPWSAEEEKQLRILFEAKKPVEVMTQALERSKGAIYAKLDELGLKVEVTSRRIVSTTSCVKLPSELPSVEEALKMLAGALKMACKPGLDKIEVQRLQVIATLARTYKDILADFLDYHGIEAQFLELRQKYEELAKKTQDIPTK
jgi:ribosomal protein L10